MKKWHIVLLVIAAVIVFLLPNSLILGGLYFGVTEGTSAEIQIDSYRLCKDADGKEVIVVKYLVKNKGKNPTSLFYEGDFYAYQDGVGLTECIDELPKECNYDTEDQYKNVKGGVEYGAEIAYYLEDADAEVEIEVDDYGIMDKKKEKTFKLK